MQLAAGRRRASQHTAAPALPTRQGSAGAARGAACCEALTAALGSTPAEPSCCARHAPRRQPPPTLLWEQRGGQHGAGLGARLREAADTRNFPRSATDPSCLPSRIAAQRRAPPAAAAAEAASLACASPPAPAPGASSSSLEPPSVWALPPWPGDGWGGGGSSPAPATVSIGWPTTAVAAAAGCGSMGTPTAGMPGTGRMRAGCPCCTASAFRFMPSTAPGTAAEPAGGGTAAAAPAAGMAGTSGWGLVGASSGLGL